MNRVITEVSGNIYRGPRPLSFGELDKLRTRKGQIIRVMNLQSGVFEFFNNDKYEKENAHEYGCIEHELHLSDFFAPSASLLKHIVGDIDVYAYCGDVIYIHCKWGKDRTGMVCAAYRILRQGWSVDDAIKELHTFGFHTFPYFFWLRQLHKLKDI